MIPKITYLNHKDTELWVITGETWSIPVKARYCDFNGTEYFHIFPAVALGFAQSAILELTVKQMGGDVEAKAGWAVPSDALRTRFSKAPGLTPEFYFRWQGDGIKTPSQEEIEVKIKERQSKLDCCAFIEHVAKASGIDAGVLTLAWIALTQQIPSWLLMGNTLHLGFSRLVAVPYRKNWKEILLTRYPTLKKALMVRDSKGLLSMAFTAASRMVRMSELTESHQRRGRTVFSHTIEVLHDSSWEKACDQVEGEGAARLGPLAYVKRWANRVSQIEDTIYEILAEQIQKETAPTCRVLWRRGQRGMQFVQASPTLIGSAQVVECDDGSCSSVDDFLGIEDSSAYLEEKASLLLQMSSVQPKDEDMRVSRGTRVSVETNNGVLVLPPSCGQTTGQAVLDRSNGCQG